MLWALNFSLIFPTIKWKPKSIFSPPVKRGSFLWFDSLSAILRSLDIYAEKEYTYNYEEGVLSRAVQYSVTLDSEKRQIARTVDCTVAYRYDKEGNLTKKTVTHADGTEQTVYYETSDETGNVLREKWRKISKPPWQRKKRVV